jgi:dTDP-4-amino-4,6-dideoxygalactose transaminase
MTDIQGALGSSQMNRANEIIGERRRLAQRYDTAFSDLDWLKLPVHIDGYIHGYQSYPCMFVPKDITLNNVNEIKEKRNEWMDKLQQMGISTRPATHAVHMLKFYEQKYNLNEKDYPNAYVANECSISLPLFHGMSIEEQDYVVNVVRGSFS